MSAPHTPVVWRMSRAPQPPEYVPDETFVLVYRDYMAYQRWMEGKPEQWLIQHNTSESMAHKVASALTAAMANEGWTLANHPHTLDGDWSALAVWLRVDGAEASEGGNFYLSGVALRVLANGEPV